MAIDRPGDAIGSEIAIVGMAGRFPGARTPDELWANVRDGIESILPLTDEDLRRSGVDVRTSNDPAYVKACAPLDDMELFDAAFFGFSPREAAILDPQHRHFMECAWEALENAGHPPERFPGSIGVFAGCGMNSYFFLNLLSNPDLVRSVGMFLLRHTGNDKDFLATRVSYLLNLTGPSLSIQTACSTSLVAVHVAAQHLLSGECDLALAGGVTIELPHRVGYRYEQGEILSPDGHCRSFDAASMGTVFGSGAGVVVLRRLADALEDNDVVHAVIKGSAVNNDGALKVGYLAPSVEGQSAAILEALAVAGVDADSIGYVEAHGTGTPIGDPIEVAALTQAFRQSTGRSGFCALGSLKSNIGHLDTAAGVAGLIKTVQALKHKELPPSLHFSTPNPAIAFEDTPFTVNATLKPWTSAGPRRAGVSALGVGGTNAHVVLEEAPPPSATDAPRARSLVLLSARSQASIAASALRLAEHVAAQPSVNVADVAFTTALGRRELDVRQFVVCAGPTELEASLRQVAVSPAPGVERRHDPPSVVMLFPGGGAQYPDMARGLYAEEPRFREEVDRALAIAERLGYGGLRALLYPTGDPEAAAYELERPAASVLSVFIVEHALARLWMAWGIRPAACVGHSLGEYVAAVLAEVMTLEDAVALVARRGEIFERLPRGAMLSVALSEAALRPLVAEHGLTIAAINAPELSVASGPVDRIDALQRVLEAREIECRRLHIAVAAHSEMLDPWLDELGTFLRTIRLSPPKLPFISNVSGRWADPESVATAEYWVTHLRQAVRFSEGLTTALAEPGCVLLEVGPGQTLSALARMHRVGGQPPVALASLRHAHESIADLETVYDALGRLWQMGCRVDWEAFYGGEARRRLALPTYAFDHQRHWIEPGAGAAAETRIDAGPLPRMADVTDWSYVPAWQKLPVVRTGDARHSWLVLSGGGAPSSAIVAELVRRGARVAVVRAGCSFKAEATDSYTVRPTESEDYRAVLDALARAGQRPDRVLSTWLLDAPASLGSPRETPEGMMCAIPRAHFVQRRGGFDALLALIPALDDGSETPIEVIALTAGAVATDQQAVQAPAQALALGPVLVAPREYPHIGARLIDVAPLEAVSDDFVDRANRIVSELGRQTPPAVTVLGANGAVGRTFARQRLGQASSESTTGAAAVAIRQDGAYLITGGFGGMGLSIARELVLGHGARVGLVGRQPLPERASWAETLEREGESSEVGRRLGAVLALERLGGRIVPLAADVTDEVSLGAAIATFERECGPINGVVHAAGVIDDQPMAMKTVAAANAVLAPKVEGALALDAALGNRAIDFFAMCSSTSALLGLPGQADYAAANAFLDAFASYRDERRPGRTVAIDWGAWRGVGMAVRAGQRRDASGGSLGPLLGRREVSSDAARVYVWTATPDSTWVLGDHRLSDGTALLPATGFVEMARAAWQDLTGEPSVRIEQLVFASPLEVTVESERHVRVSIERRDGSGWSFRVESAAAAAGPWDEHATAILGAASLARESSEPLIEARRKCPIEVPSGSARDVWQKQSRHVAFGPRWDVVREARVGDGEALIHLALAAPFVGDLETFAAHPALVDLAAVGGIAALDDYDRTADFFVPFSMGCVEIGPLPSSIWAHARTTGDVAGVSCALDVRLFDESGRLVGRLDEFVLRRVDHDRLSRRPSGPADRAGGPDVARPRDVASLFARLLADGISPYEGAGALMRVLEAGLGPQVVVSAVDFSAVQAEVSRLMPRAARRTAAAPAARSAAPAAATPVEAAIAAMWEDLLGVKGVGLDDDFFALGGHSLLAVRLATRMKRELQTFVPLTAFFEARTVRQLASLVSPSMAAPRDEVSVPTPRSPALTSLVPIRVSGTRPPMFAVHAGAGQVLFYRSLAALLPDDQPFFGLQAPAGLAGEAPPYGSYSTVEELATVYLAELKASRPHGPYVLIGSCAGGPIALEMAQRLRRAGDTVGPLVVFDSWLYHTSARSRETRLERHRRALNGQTLGGAVRYLAGKVSATASYHAYSTGVRLRAIPKRVRQSMAEATARATGGVLSQEALDRAFIKASEGLMARYHPEPYDGPVILFRSATYRQNLAMELDQVETMGWGGISDGHLEIVDMPGDHLVMLEEPIVHDVVRAVEARLERAEGILA